MENMCKTSTILGRVQFKYRLIWKNVAYFLPDEQNDQLNVIQSKS